MLVHSPSPGHPQANQYQALILTIFFHTKQNYTRESVSKVNVSLVIMTIQSESEKIDLDFVPTSRLILPSDNNI